MFDPHLLLYVPAASESIFDTKSSFTRPPVSFICGRRRPQLCGGGAQHPPSPSWPIPPWPLNLRRKTFPAPSPEPSGQTRCQLVRDAVPLISREGTEQDNRIACGGTL